MNFNHNITKSLFALVDDLWVYAAPLLLAYIMKDFIANLVAYCRIRWSKMDYNSVGQAKVLIDGHWQHMFKLEINVLAFEYRDDKGNRIITTMSPREYWKRTHTFMGKTLDS